MTMFKLETMIYASEDGTNSVFTLNPDLQKQLAALAAQYPEVCCHAMGESERNTLYRINGVKILISR